MSDQQVEQDVTNGKVTAAEENGTNIQQQSGPSEDNGTTVPPQNGSDSRGVDDTGVVEQESEKQASSKPEGAQSTPEPQQEVESVTSRTSSPIDDGVGLRDVLRRLVAGSSATKVKSKSKLLPRIYQITPDLHYITWRPSKKPLPRSRSEYCRHSDDRTYTHHPPIHPPTHTHTHTRTHTHKHTHTHTCYDSLFDRQYCQPCHHS